MCAALETGPSDKEDGDDPPDEDPSDGETENEDGTPNDGDGADSGGSQPDEKTTLPPLASPDPEPDERLIDSAPDMSELELAISPTPSVDGLPTSATTDNTDDGSQPPLAGVLALLVTAGMVGTAVYLVRKRATEPED